MKTGIAVLTTASLVILAACDRAPDGASESPPALATTEVRDSADETSPSTANSGPESVLRGYLEARSGGSFDVAYRYLSSTDREARSIDEFDDPLATMHAARSEYRILEIQRTEKRADATVEVTGPDLGQLMGDVLGAAFASAFGGGEEAEIGKAIAEKYEGGELPTTTTTEHYTLVEEAEGWRVFHDWLRQDEVRRLYVEALELKLDGDLRGALSKFDELLALDPHHADAKSERPELAEKIALLEARDAYRDRISLYDVEAAYYETSFDGRVPGVKFKVKNLGERTLRKLEVTVFFEDASGAVIAEERFHPVSRFSMRGPLKPNYVWQLDRGTFYEARSVPSEWEEGAISVEVTDLAFVE